MGPWADAYNQFGIHPQSLNAGSGEITSLLGTPITTDFIKRWRESSLSEKDHETIERQLGSQLNAILKGVRNLEHGTQRHVISKISTLFMNFKDDPKLSRHIDSHLESIGEEFSRPPMSVRELKEKFRRIPGMQKRLSKYHDDEIATISEKSVPVWLPQQGAAVVTLEDGSRKPAFIVSGSRFRILTTITLRGKKFEISGTQTNASLIMPPSK